MDKSDKRNITIIKLAVILDGQVVLGEFEQLCIPGIRRSCVFDYAKYAPEVIVEGIEYNEMEIIPRH